MIETIQVGYTHVFVDGISVYHKYILYTNSAGDKFYARGGPVSSFTSAPWIIAIESGGYIRGTPDWDYGRDTGADNPYPDAIPHPRETIITGDDLSSQWQSIKGFMEDIGNREIPYGAITSNSNATVDEALRRSGLPTPTQDGWDDYWSPGSDFDMPGGDSPFWETIKDIVNTLFNAAYGWLQPRYDPLTLDLDGDGLETVGIDPNNPILFDLDGDGIKTGTGWVKPDDGFLVLDRNGNGTIDSGRELFGDATLLEGGGTAADGFAALVEEDTNADGRVDALDARFAQLRIWRDLNQNGLSEAGELSTLDAAGIVAIRTAKTEHSATLANGNQIADKGAYVRVDGTEGDLVEVTGDLADINLADNPFYSEFTDAIALTVEAQALPNMAGSGAVRDLQEAANDGVFKVRRTK